MTPYYADDLVTIYHGDCREFMPLADVIVTDPPFGVGLRTPSGPGRREARQIVGDQEGPPDLSHLLRVPLTMAVFGGNLFADQLPVTHGWLVWDKRLGDDQKRQADAELIWTNFVPTVRLIRHPWNGGGTFQRENGTPESLHPAQKPVAVMRAILGYAPVGDVLDPYAGSGSTLVAAKSLGRRAVGIEIEERYCEIAARRCSQEVLGLAV